MRYPIAVYFLAGILRVSSVGAEEVPSLEPQSFRESLYSVSSDDLDPAESLNRVSGEIDLGFSSPAQSYESEGHYKPGPFAREKAVESS